MLLAILTGLRTSTPRYRAILFIIAVFTQRSGMAPILVVGKISRVAVNTEINASYRILLLSRPLCFESLFFTFVLKCPCCGLFPPLVAVDAPPPMRPEGTHRRLPISSAKRGGRDPENHGAVDASALCMRRGTSRGESAQVLGSVTKTVWSCMALIVVLAGHGRVTV